MKIAIVHNNNESSITLAGELRLLLKKAALKIDERHPDLVITIGGDGTLLSAFHRYAHMLDRVRFVGVHTGHLGFYTDWRDYELSELVTSLIHDKGESISYPLLDVRATYQGRKEPSHFLALNESTMKRVDGTMVCDVFIKDELLSVLEETASVSLRLLGQRGIINRLEEQLFTRGWKRCS